MEITRVCKTCSTTTASRWYKNYTECASCNKKEWYKNNKIKALSKGREWNANNSDVKKLLNSKWYAENREHQLAKNKEFNKNNAGYAKEWRKSNPETTRALSAKYRATKLNATLLGFNDELAEIYKEAHDLQLLDGIEREVHHVIPLQEYSDKVCGLHVPWNLEILTKEEHLDAHDILRKVYKYGNEPND